MSYITARLADRGHGPSRLREGLDPALDSLVMRCLAKNPADRYADAGELVEALEHIALNESVSVRTNRHSFGDATRAHRARRATMGPSWSHGG